MLNESSSNNNLKFIQILWLEINDELNAIDYRAKITNYPVLLSYYDLFQF